MTHSEARRPGDWHQRVRTEGVVGKPTAVLSRGIYRSPGNASLWELAR